MRRGNFPQRDASGLVVPFAELVAANRGKPHVAVLSHVRAVAADVAHHAPLVHHHAFGIHRVAVDLPGLRVQPPQVLPLELRPEHMAVAVYGQVMRKDVRPDGIRIALFLAVHVRFGIVLVIADGKVAPLPCARIDAAQADQAVRAPDIPVVVDHRPVQAMLEGLVGGSQGQVGPRMQGSQVLDEHRRSQRFFVQRIFDVQAQYPGRAVRAEVVRQVIREDVVLLVGNAAG